MKEVYNLSYLEAEKYYEFYNKIENEKVENILKSFAVYNLDSSRVAYHGKQNDVKKYIDSIFRNEDFQENDIENQFKGIDFG